MMLTDLRYALPGYHSMLLMLSSSITMHVQTRGGNVPMLESVHGAALYKAMHRLGPLCVHSSRLIMLLTLL